MWIVLLLMGILFVDYAVLRASHLKNDEFLDDEQQMHALRRGHIQYRKRVEQSDE